jgi:hypothetical protein
MFHRPIIIIDCHGVEFVAVSGGGRTLARSLCDIQPVISSGEKKWGAPPAWTLSCFR